MLITNENLIGVFEKKINDKKQQHSVLICFQIQLINSYKIINLAEQLSLELKI